MPYALKSNKASQTKKYIMKTRFILALAAAMAFAGSSKAQYWNITGNAGIAAGTNYLGTSDPNDLVIRTNALERGRVLGATGEWRFGGTTNYASIDANGRLRFAGTGVYQVGGNKYAFQYSGNPNYGLFFNTTNDRYEFRDGSAAPVFYVTASTGAGTFLSSLKVGAYTLPATDGTANQVLKTNGAGVLTWSNDNNSANGWNLTGNSGTSAGTNFIGTTDLQALVFKTNNLEGIRLLTDGKVGIGTTVPNSRLHINTVSGEDAFRVQIAGNTRFLINDAGGVSIGTTTEGPANGLYVNGDIGIGASAPTARLHINSSTGEDALKVQVSSITKLFMNSDGGLSVGSSTAAPINGLYVSGNTGIGTSLPSQKLHVSGNTYITGNLGVGVSAPTSKIHAAGNLTFEGDGYGINFDGGGFIKDAIGTSNVLDVHADLIPDNTNSHDLGSSTVQWQDVWSINGPVAPISSHTTTNVQDLSYGLNEVLKLRPVMYNRKDNPAGQPSIKRIGLMAEEVKNVIPEAVRDWKYSEDKAGKISKVAIQQPGISMDNIIPVLVKSIQELEAQIAELKKQLNGAEQTITTAATENNAAIAKPVTGASLEQNAPNPFTNSTVIRYHIPSSSKAAQIIISNATGNMVKTFTLAGKGAGSVTINANELAAGSYYYTLIVDGKKADSKQMILVK